MYKGGRDHETQSKEGMGINTMTHALRGEHRHIDDQAERNSRRQDGKGE